jgi:hypothetical protein
MTTSSTDPAGTAPEAADWRDQMRYLWMRGLVRTA